jgi:arginyl-tRNA synthetase
MNIKETIRQLIEEALDNCAKSGLFSEKQSPSFVIETPKMKDHGDYATNVAMLLAPLEKKPPRKIAQDIIQHIPKKKGQVYV